MRGLALRPLDWRTNQDGDMILVPPSCMRLGLASVVRGSKAQATGFFKIRALGNGMPSTRSLKAVVSTKLPSLADFISFPFISLVIVERFT